MKISVNDEVLFELSPTELQVIGNDIGPEEMVIADLKRRLEWVVAHKHAQCLERLKNQYVPILKQRGEKSMPLDDEMMADLIFSLPEYQPMWKVAHADRVQNP